MNGAVAWMDAMRDARSSSSVARGRHPSTGDRTGRRDRSVVDGIRR
jgi:hypothetical protein